MKPTRSILLALAGGLVALVVLVVVLSGDDEGSEVGPVGQSSLDGFPSRGELAGDQDLLDEAAETWRSSERVADGEFEAPGPAVEVLWAGEAPARFDEGTEPLIVLYDPGSRAVAVIQTGAEGEDLSVLSVDVNPYSSFAVESGGTVLTSADLPPLELIETESNPTRALETRALDPEDGLIAEASEDDIIVPASAAPKEAADATGQVPLIATTGTSFVVDRGEWQAMYDLIHDRVQSANVSAAIAGAQAPDDGGSLTSGAALLTPLLAQRFPNGRPGVVIAKGGEASAGVGLAYYDPRGDESSTVSLAVAEPGELDAAALGDGADAARPILAAQVVSPGAPRERFLVAAGDEEIERLRIEAGSAAIELAGSAAIVDTTRLPDLGRPEVPPVLVAGFTADGTVVPAR